MDPRYTTGSLVVLTTFPGVAAAEVHVDAPGHITTLRPCAGHQVACEAGRLRLKPISP
jgi:hypothetical protein